jgi:hypothetical protein
MFRSSCFIAAALLVGTMWSTPTQASNCGVEFQHAYEKGVRHGRIDGSQQLGNNPSRHASHLFEHINEGSRRAECYLEGYNIGYGNAYADSNRRPSYDDAPEYGTNERAYYDDGCRDGTGDAQMGMSMMHDRHPDMYDSRFEPYFKQGYEACWRQYR